MVKVFCSERPAAQTDRATLVGHWSSHHWTGPIINKEQLWSLLAYISKYPPCACQCALLLFASVLQAARASRLWWGSSGRLPNAHIYPRPKKNDAFPERAAYSRGLRHAWSMYTGGGCRSPDTASTTRDADEQHSGLLAKWRRHDR